MREYLIKTLPVFCHKLHEFFVAQLVARLPAPPERLEKQNDSVRDSGPDVLKHPQWTQFFAANNEMMNEFDHSDLNAFNNMPAARTAVGL